MPVKADCWEKQGTHRLSLLFLGDPTPPEKLRILLFLSDCHLRLFEETALLSLVQTLLPPVGKHGFEVQSSGFDSGPGVLVFAKL